MFQFFIRDDVFHAGRDVCGTPIERLAYYVIAEAPNGRRFAHERSFIGHGGEAAAEHLRERIQKAYTEGGEPEWDKFWWEVDPAYGSDAYQGLDAEKFFRNREIMEAHEAGEINTTDAARLMVR